MTAGAVVLLAAVLAAGTDTACGGDLFDSSGRKLCRIEPFDCPSGTTCECMASEDDVHGARMCLCWCSPVPDPGPAAAKRFDPRTGTEARLSASGEWSLLDLLDRLDIAWDGDSLALERAMSRRPLNFSTRGTARNIVTFLAWRWGLDYHWEGDLLVLEGRNGR